jgi:multidrug efflux pump subunit AcrB
VEHLANLLIPTSIPGLWVPLRQVADLEPDWHPAFIERRNAVRTITVGADLRGNTSQVEAEKQIKKWVKSNLSDLPEGVSITYGGLSSLNAQMVPQILWSVAAALAVMLVLLLYHFGRFSTAILALSSSLLCIFGAMLGLWIFDLDISITAVLGFVSLIGIIVRNAIMMYEYADDLRRYNHMDYCHSAFMAGIRRMRPVFLTSATTALGVLPMIISRNPLWMPMGVVICFGVVLSMVIILAVMPVMYWQIFRTSKTTN